MDTKILFIAIFTIWVHIDKYNIAKLKQLSATGAKNAPSEMTNSLEPARFLSTLISNF
ncbi:22937_t:CDS:2 [Gigaspora margarita]|uniref:22937_t:CDS:1 n=1 Tax=Gigaspora margarita TaxID=4874 RepID=A0ABM8VZH9_GIGMA|nr:22937_t:CDS:2 [Gigaspora margarita]